MTPNNATVFLCSMLNFDKRLKYYGDASLTEIMLLKLIYKYACYSPTSEILNKLDEIVSSLQTSSNLICVNKIETGNFYPDHVDPFGTGTGTGANSNAQATNTPPTVLDLIINSTNTTSVNYNNSAIPVPILTEVHKFAKANFTNGFADADGDSPGNDIIISSLPATGELRYNNVPVVAGQVITNPALLKYFKITNSLIAETFTFRISDDNDNNPAYSNVATITLNIPAVTNAAPTIGDSAMYVGNNVTTVLTVEMFSSQLNPSYVDSEGDALDAIRIDEVSTANQGQFLYLGFPVVVGQVITAAELSAGNFTHVGANVNTLSSDAINFAVRDTGSLTWVV